MTQEIWKPIPGFEGYKVSNTGKVLSDRGLSPRILKPGVKNGRPYLCVNLRKNKKTFNIMVHQLVLLAFVGPRPDDMVSCHNDDNPQHNHIDNLRYDTQSANLADACKNGARSLSPKNVRYIRMMAQSKKKSARELSNELDVSVGIIFSVITGRAYNHIK